MIDTVVFEGFTVGDDTSCTVALPANWPEVSKAIDNLAELKVVQLVLWVTWGASQADALMPLTLDDFTEVTGLSIQSVRSGIEKAIEHGYIERQEDKGVRYYGIKLLQVQDLIVSEVSISDEPASEADAQDLDFSSSNEFERDTHNNISGDILRNQEASNLDVDEHPCKGLLSKADNATLCSRMESLSSALGDHEHTASNIGLARRILANYQARGGNFEDFLLLMYEARDLARRKTKIRRKNRMPYFFKCLRTACDSGRQPAELLEAS